MNNEEKKKFVLDYIAGQLFTNFELSRMDLLFRVFMPLTFMPEINYSDIGCVYEYKSECLVELLELPVFGSCRIIHKEDWLEITDMIKKVQTAVEKVLEA